MLTLTLTVALAVFFTAIFLNYYVKDDHKEMFAKRSLVIAEMLSHSTLASVAFMDIKQAQEELSVLLKIPDIRYACLFNSQLNRVLAEINQRDVVDRRCGPFPNKDFRAANDQEISIYKVLERRGVEVGGLYLVLSNREQIKQRKNMMLIFIASSVIACLLALMLTSRMSASLYRPLQDLGRTSKMIAKQRDWSLRAEKQSEDELGELVDTFNQMVEIIERDQEELKRLAFYDSLTGVPNRRMLERKIIRAMARAKRLNKCYAIIFIDLDDFKWVNDKLGHDQGDVLLKTITERINEGMRIEDTLARFGGDEFVILAEMINDRAEVETICTRVIASLDEKILLKDVVYQARISVGAVFANPEDGDMYQLLKKADIALYEAKDRGKNQYQLYSEQVA